MDWSDTHEQAAFRAEVRRFVGEGLPPRYRALIDEGRDEGWTFNWSHHATSSDGSVATAAREWVSRLSSRGWIAPHWPREYGGAGMTTLEYFIFSQELAEAGVPMAIGPQAVQMFGPTLIIHGSEEQKREQLPRILGGEVIWAQGYSEPGAGSDLASLQTRAVRDGDEYVLNGQKIWTSEGHLADMLFALVRTDPDAPKHRGISFLYMDAKTPGITVRPLINMAFEHGFNEVFFEDARVPVRNRVGEENRGWYVAMTLLDFERSGISGAISLRRHLDHLVRYAQSEQGRERTELGRLPALRAEVAERVVESEVGLTFSMRIASMQHAGVVPNYEASMSKMFLSEIRQRAAQTGVRALGLYANLWDEDDARAPLMASYTRSLVSSIPITIGGGSSEIQRNIIATRGLGLPRG